MRMNPIYLFAIRMKKSGWNDESTVEETMKHFGHFHIVTKVFFRVGCRSLFGKKDWFKYFDKKWKTKRKEFGS